ncbi:MAG: hypothetical protein ABW186_03120, partial [Rhodanobacteraceae bacterium]
ETAIAALARQFEDITSWLGYEAMQGEASREGVTFRGSEDAILQAIRTAGVRFADDGWLAHAVRSACDADSFAQSIDPGSSVNAAPV